MDKVQNRYMFDTNAINRISQDSYDEMLIYESKSHGYEYYFTEIQVYESQSVIEKQTADIDSNLVERDRAVYSLNLLRLISKLQTKYVGQIMTLLPNRSRLDGTFELLSDGEEESVAMFWKIMNNNDIHYEDAMIALVAIVNGCILVTNDKRLFNKINSFFPGRAIKYEDFIALLK